MGAYGGGVAQRMNGRVPVHQAVFRYGFPVAPAKIRLYSGTLRLLPNDSLDTYIPILPPR